MTHFDVYKLPSDKQNAVRKWHGCETQLTTVINDWAKILDNQGHIDTFIWISKNFFDTLHMNALIAYCLATELAVKHVTDNRELS